MNRLGAVVVAIVLVAIGLWWMWSPRPQMQGSGDTAAKGYVHVKLSVPNMT